MASTRAAKLVGAPVIVASITAAAAPPSTDGATEHRQFPAETHG
jgi:hypothetical protein